MNPTIFLSLIFLPPTFLPLIFLSKKSPVQDQLIQVILVFLQWLKAVNCDIFVLVPFRVQYHPEKALPTPAIMALLKQQQFKFEVSIRSIREFSGLE